MCFRNMQPVPNTPKASVLCMSLSTRSTHTYIHTHIQFLPLLGTKKGVMVLLLIPFLFVYPRLLILFSTTLPTPPVPNPDQIYPLIYLICLFFVLVVYYFFRALFKLLSISFFLSFFLFLGVFSAFYYHRGVDPDPFFFRFSECIILATVFFFTLSFSLSYTLDFFYPSSLHSFSLSLSLSGYSDWKRVGNTFRYCYYFFFCFYLRLFFIC